MRRWFRNLLLTLLLVFPVAFIIVTYLEDVAQTTSQGGELLAFLAGLPRNVIVLASEAGYMGIFVLMLLEAAAFPIPSEIILPFAGYLVSQGILDFWVVVFLTTVAALLGSFADYYLGWKIGDALASERSRVPFVNAAHLRRVKVWFRRYGPVAVASFRLIPAARVLISFPAGASRMNKSKFAFYTLAGCLPWNFVLVYLGWWLGSSWSEVVEAFRYINVGVYAFLVVFVALLAWRLVAKRSTRVRSLERLGRPNTSDFQQFQGRTRSIEEDSVLVDYFSSNEAFIA